MDPTTSPRHPRTTRTGTDRTNRRSRRLASAAVGGLALTMLLAGACSDEDAASNPTTTERVEHATDDRPTGGGAPLVGDPMSAEVCGAFSALSAAMTGDPSMGTTALEQLESSLPPELEDQGTIVVDSLTAAFGGDEAAFGAPEFVTAYEEFGTAMWEGCEASDRLDITGFDYGFLGVPATVNAGLVAVRFTNDTTAGEPHELIVVQRPSGDETPVDEIATMSPDELMADFPMIGVAFADAADTSSTTFMELPAGSYVAICTIPVGGGESGDPHAAHGMIAEFEVA